jgi:DNA-binding transcriptional MocR family regulator
MATSFATGGLLARRRDPLSTVHLERFLSDASRRATRSDIRELLKLVARPEVISLAGGMPPPEAFPVDDLIELLPAVLARHAGSALQYGPTEGDPGLRESIVQWMVATEG